MCVCNVCVWCLCVSVCVRVGCVYLKGGERGEGEAM